MEMSEFIRRMERHISDRDARTEAAAEMEGHIMEQTEAYMAEGLSEREAEDMAVKQMGNPDGIGRMMNEVHRPKIEWKPLLYIAVWMGFVFLGRVMFTLANESGVPFEIEHIRTMYAPFDVFRYVGYLFVAVGFCLSLYEKYAGLPFFNAISNWQGAGVIYNGCALCGIGIGCIAHNPRQLLTVGIPVIAVIGVQREYMTVIRSRKEAKYLWITGIAETDINDKGTARFEEEIKKVQISKGDDIKKGAPVVVTGVNGSVLIVEPLC